MAGSEGRTEQPQGGESGPGRRQFLRTLSGAFLGIWALGGAGALAAYMRAPEEDHSSTDRIVRIGKLDELRIGEARLVRHGVSPFFVIRTGSESVIALSAVCTHVRCILDYDHERRGLVCPCHDGRFDLNGNVVSGPPPRALPTYEVSTRAGEVFVRV
ncbi:MAG: Rieske (2Fe-2S) protein [Candidatus Eisenbacteria bacterium]|uniref:Rieske (2Fe-2S) protein n=1 Tax=Eiseniibacteriota bacterium TaxID=2212470 RepID=A0A933SC66_UNCEI|nr:Rieske (2Fe-2S) protein [Candidatus Eisenbacteria bacterium]